MHEVFCLIKVNKYCSLIYFSSKILSLLAKFEKENKLIKNMDNDIKIKRENWLKCMLNDKLIKNIFSVNYVSTYDTFFNNKNLHL